MPGPSAEQREAALKLRDERILSAYGPGHVQMGECSLCGWLEWLRSFREEPSSMVSIHPLDGCQRCMMVAQRAPEIYQWMVGVAATLYFQIDEVKKELKGE